MKKIIKATLNIELARKEKNFFSVWNWYVISNWKREESIKLWKKIAHLMTGELKEFEVEESEDEDEDESFKFSYCWEYYIPNINGDCSIKINSKGCFFITLDEDTAEMIEIKATRSDMINFIEQSKEDSSIDNNKLELLKIISSMCRFDTRVKSWYYSY